MHYHFLEHSFEYLATLKDSFLISLFFFFLSTCFYFLLTYKWLLSPIYRPSTSLMHGRDQFNLMVENSLLEPSLVISRYLQGFKTSLESSILIFIYLLVSRRILMLLESSRFVSIHLETFRKIQYLLQASTSLHIILELSRSF